MGDVVRPATEQEIDRHNTNFNAGLHEFRRIFYTLNGERIEHDTQPHIFLLADEIEEIRRCGGSEIAIYNSLTASPSTEAREGEEWQQ